MSFTTRNEAIALDVALGIRTLGQIGDRYGITRERVRQIRDAALRQMGADQQLARHWRDLEVA